MKAERVRVIVVDSVASAIGAAGMIQQLFFRPQPDIMITLFCLGILMFPAGLALLWLRLNGGGNGGSSTLESSSSSPPQSPSSSSSSPSSSA